MWQRLSRSELLSTFFPSWIWQGREWAKWRVPKYDPYYWINAHAHPVVSTYYPPSIISSFLGEKTVLDAQFGILVTSLFLHVLFAFVGWYYLVASWANSLIALFGAITLTFSAYNWKQQPCFQYTVAWFPFLLLGIAKHSILLSSISFGMILLAGYYPIGLQITLIAVGASVLWDSPLLWLPIGTLIGLPQLIPFLRYLPKTIRMNKVSEIGKIPWWHPITLLFPKSFRCYINDIGPWEAAYYVGIAPLMVIGFSTSRVWLLAVVSYLLMIGVGSKYLPRIPARWCFSFQFALGWAAVSGLDHLHLTNSSLVSILLIQVFDLWQNNKDLLINHPYAELYQKPSWAFNTRLTRYLKENLRDDERVSGLPYPLFTGHINGFRSLGYSGGMQLRLMSKWRNDKNPNGSGQHDWFKSGEDNWRLDVARVKYAYTTAVLDWPKTPIKHLYLNPRFKK